MEMAMSKPSIIDGVGLGVVPLANCDCSGVTCNCSPADTFGATGGTLQQACYDLKQKCN